jgi:flagellin
MRKLSSGKRITRTSDDPAASQIAESFTTQIKGSTRAARNAYDAANLARMSEASLGSIANILHKVRELAVQSGSDLMTKADRENLQVGAKALIDEIESIGENTNFAGLSVLDGSFLGKSVHIGPGYRDAQRVSIADTRAQYLGRYAITHTSRVSSEGLDTGDIFINDVRIRASLDSDDNLSTTQRNASAISKAAAINDATRRSNVNAIIDANSMTGENDILGGTLDGSNYLIINGEVIGGQSAMSGDADNRLKNAINDYVQSTGVIASIDRNGRLKLSAEDGRNIHVQTVGRAGEVTGLSANDSQRVQRGTMTIVSDDVFTVTDRTNNGGEFKIGLHEDDIIGRNELDVISTVDISTRSGANRALVILDRSQEAVIRSRSKLGGLENRLNYTVSRLNEVAKNAYIARGKVVDVDVAKESAELAKSSIVQTAFSNVLAQANQESFRVLNLL